MRCLSPVVFRFRFRFPRCYPVLVERLTPQFALFLVTALLMEQPVLLVAEPGGDELLMHAGTLSVTKRSHPGCTSLE